MRERHVSGRACASRTPRLGVYFNHDLSSICPAGHGGRASGPAWADEDGQLSTFGCSARTLASLVPSQGNVSVNDIKGSPPQLRKYPSGIGPNKKSLLCFQACGGTNANRQKTTTSPPPVRTSTAPREEEAEVATKRPTCTKARGERGEDHRRRVRRAGLDGAWRHRLHL